MIIIIILIHSESLLDNKLNVYLVMRFDIKQVESIVEKGKIRVSIMFSKRLLPWGRLIKRFIGKWLIKAAF